MNDCNIEWALLEYDRCRNNKRADKHMDGFGSIINDFFSTNGLIVKKNQPVGETEYRSKRWDYSIWSDEKLEAVIELKSLGKSANKNINNRMEEALGCASFMSTRQPSVKKGYIFIGDELEENTKKRWLNFFGDCLSNKWYDGICCIMLDNNRNFVCPSGMNMENLLQSLFKHLTIKKE